MADNLWPLPETGVRESGKVRKDDFPMTGTLIDIAIDEKQLDEVIRWYDQQKVPSFRFGLTWFQDDKVAKAIAESYPDRAIAIWKKFAEDQIAQTKPKAMRLLPVSCTACGTLLKAWKRERMAGLRFHSAAGQCTQETPVRGS